MIVLMQSSTCKLRRVKLLALSAENPEFGCYTVYLHERGTQTSVGELHSSGLELDSRMDARIAGEVTDGLL